VELGDHILPVRVRLEASDGTRFVMREEEGSDDVGERANLNGNDRVEALEGHREWSVDVVVFGSDEGTCVVESGCFLGVSVGNLPILVPFTEC
jgi:hypothetical protein